MQDSEQLCPDCGYDFQIGDWPLPCKGRGHTLGGFWKGDAQPHVRERAVVYKNPLTGEHRTPARADTPMPEVYARQGYERHEIMNMAKHERDTGSVHEATNFNRGNEETNYRDPKPVERKVDPAWENFKAQNSIRSGLGDEG